MSNCSDCEMLWAWIKDLDQWLNDPEMVSQFSQFGSAGGSMALDVVRQSLHKQFPQLASKESAVEMDARDKVRAFLDGKLPITDISDER